MSKKDKVIMLRSRGFSYSEIAKRCDCCKGYISATVQRHKHGGSRPTDLAWARKKRAKRKKMAMVRARAA